MKLGKGTYIFSHLHVDVLLQLYNLLFTQLSCASSSEYNVSEGTLTSDFVVEGNNGALNNQLVIIDDFLETSC